MENRRDLSISMERANLLVLFTGVPVAVAQFVIFTLIHRGEAVQITWGFPMLIAAVILGIVVHELIHGVAWKLLGQKPFSTIKFGFQWKSFTPYAHLKEPVEVNAYRLGAFMPGFLLGIFPYLLSLVLGDGNLFWFSLAHTAGASGDWLILWLIRNVRPGTQVQDHPTHAGCYVLES
jgi:hypothetical protein